jgi:hypothetical protein
LKPVTHYTRTALLLFLSTAMLFVTRPCIEADEALVANPTFFVWLACR